MDSMRNISFTLMATLVTGAALWGAAAAPPPDTLPATGGNITIAPLNHATLQLVWAGHVIDVDPTPQANYTGLTAPDIILITDIHGDHLSPPTITQIRKPTTKIVAPAAAASQLENPIVMANGETKTVDGISIEAVPMYNLPKAGAQVPHEKGRGNGYIVTLGGKRIYIAGDTEGTPEMRALKNIDVAFVCMNLPYTMPPDEAADAVKAFHPKIVIPYHYRGSDLTVFQKRLEGTGIEVRLLDWYPQ